MFLLPLGGRGGGESRPEGNILCIIVLMSASPPPRVGPPTGRGSNPSHCVGGARCVWRTHTYRPIATVECGEKGAWGEQWEIKTEEGFRGRKFPEGWQKGRHTEDEDEYRWEWTGWNKIIIGRSRIERADRNNWTTLWWEHFLTSPVRWKGRSQTI